MQISVGRFQFHVNGIVSRVKRSMSMLYRSGYYASRRCSRLLFPSLVLPIFLTLLGFGTVLVRLLEVAYSSLTAYCCRIVLGDGGYMPTTPSKNVYKLMNLMPLPLLFHLRTGCIVLGILSCPHNAVVNRQDASTMNSTKQGNMPH
jgi:hypothetical protein